MIKINLLGVPKPKKGKRGGAAVAMPAGGGGEGIHPVVILMIALLITVVGMGYWYITLQNQHAKLQSDYTAAQKKKQELAVLESKVKEKESQRDAFERRVKVISDLEAKRSGPVDLLTMVSTTVNQTDAVWLDAVNDEGGDITMTGQALDVHALANLITNLQKTGYFKDVELKETTQNEDEVMAFAFTLKCQKKS